MNLSNRLISIDVFRGLTIAAMILVNYPGAHGYSYAALEHARWNGTTPTDFIFPFFIFIVGVSIALSFTKQVEAAKPKTEMVKKILVRSLKIWLIGLFLHYLPGFDFSFIDLFGVLQRIAEIYLACALLFLFTTPRTQVYIFSGILLIYWITMSFIPINGMAAGILEPGKDFSTWFDRLLFSPKMLGKHGWNTEGLYSTFSSIASGIAGMLAGQFIISRKLSERTLIWLFTAGILSILAGSVWDWQFPINKRLWTSSYVLYTAGWATVGLAISLWLIDFMNFKNNLITRVGIIFGMNAIAVYVSADIFETIYKYTHLHNIVFKGLIRSGVSEPNASLAWALISVGSSFLVALFLYRKKIFIKL